MDSGLLRRVIINAHIEADKQESQCCYCEWERWIPPRDTGDDPRGTSKCELRLPEFYQSLRTCAKYRPTHQHLNSNLNHPSSYFESWIMKKILEKQEEEVKKLDLCQTCLRGPSRDDRCETCDPKADATGYKEHYLLKIIEGKNELR